MSPPGRHGPLHGRPLPPGRHEPPHPPLRPPHERRQGKQLLATSVLVGAGVTAVCAVALYMIGVQTNVILPTSAPILVGTTTLAYTFLSR